MTRAEGLSKSNDVSWVVKGSLLLLLAFQNAALNVFNRYSRVIANDPDSGPGYVKSSLVVVVEFSKIFGSIFLFVIIDCRGDVRDALHRFFQATFRHPKEVLKLMVPATLYVIQNNLVLVAADNLDGPVLAVLSQLKIATTAIISVALLGRQICERQWLAIVFLMVGVSCVQVSAMLKPNDDAVDTAEESASQEEKHRMLLPIVRGVWAPMLGDSDEHPEDIEHGDSIFLGVVASVAAASTSGFAGVYFEKVLKGSETSVWIRNIHLALFSVFLAAGGVCIQPSEMHQIHEFGFFAGYNQTVWIAAIISGGGGLLVAAVVKYADNILKAFATSCSLVGVAVISVFFFDFPTSSLFLSGVVVVMYAVFLYSDLIKELPCGCRFLPAILGGNAFGNHAEINTSSTKDVELEVLLEKSSLQGTCKSNT